MSKQTTMTEAELRESLHAALEELGSAERSLWAAVPVVAAYDASEAERLAKSARRISELRDLVTETLRKGVARSAPPSLGKSRGRA